MLKITNKHLFKRLADLTFITNIDPGSTSNICIKHSITDTKISSQISVPPLSHNLKSEKTQQDLQ